MAVPVLWFVVFAFTNLRLSDGNNRHAVYWNSSNIQYVHYITLLLLSIHYIHLSILIYASLDDMHRAI